MIIYPAIDLRGGQCVRLRQGDYNQETVFGRDPAEMAKRWVADGAEFLHLVDLDGAKAGHPVNLDAIRSIVSTIDIPCQLGGGIRDDQSIEQLLDEFGVGRVIIGTQALKQPDWFRAAINKYPDRIALGIDAKNSFVATEGWLDVSQVSVFDLAKQFQDCPLAALIYTNIANDGMMQGIDDQTIDDLCQLADLGFPVIASGGVTTLDDVRKLADRGQQHPNLNGMIIGRALYEEAIKLPAALALVT